MHRPTGSCLLVVLALPALGQEPATVHVRTGVPATPIRWAGADEHTVRSASWWRTGVAPGPATVHFGRALDAVAPSLGLTVPPGADVEVVAAYPPPADLLFAHDFAVPAHGAEVLETDGGASTWSVQDGVLTRHGSEARPGPSLLLFAGEATAAARLRVRVRLGENAALGVALGFRGRGDALRLDIDAGAGLRRLSTWTDGVQHILGENGRSLVGPGWHDIAIVCARGSVQVLVDGRAVLGGAIDAVPTGRIALIGSGTGVVAFDDLEVHRTAAATTRALHVEDFSLPRLVGYEARIPAGAGSEGSWHGRGGELVHAAFTSESPDDTESTLVTVRGREWRDVHAAVTVQPGGGPCGLMFRHLGPGDHYRAVLDPGAGALRLERCLGGEPYRLASAPVSLAEGERHRLAVHVEGFRIRVLLDHQARIGVLDGAHVRGRVGLFAAATAGAVFDRLEVLPPWNDVPVLAAVTDAGGTTVYGAHTAHPGAEVWLTLREPAAGPLLLPGAPWSPLLLPVVQRTGRFLAGAWRPRVSPRGRLECRLEGLSVPPAPGMAFDLTGWIVDPGREGVLARLPVVRVR